MVAAMMEVSHSALFQETAALLDDLMGVYSTNDELNRMTSLKMRHREVQRSGKEREENASELIRRLQKRVEIARRKCVRVQPREVHEARVAETEAAISTAKKNVAAMMEESKGLERKQVALQNDAASLAEKRRELENLASAEVPRSKNELSLYKNISRVKWLDSDVPGTIKGHVFNPDKGGMQMFSLNVGDEGGIFNLTNKLWDLMDE